MVFLILLEKMLEFRLTFGLDVELTTTLNGEREVLLALSCSALELISFWFGEGLLTGFLKIVKNSEKKT